MVTRVAVAGVCSQLVPAGGVLVAHVSTESTLVVICVQSIVASLTALLFVINTLESNWAITVTHEPVSMEPTDASAGVASFSVVAVSVNMAIVFRHFAFILVCKKWSINNFLSDFYWTVRWYAASEAVWSIADLTKQLPVQSFW